jgi:hypothetical protein
VPEAEFVEPAEPDEGRLDAGAFTMEELKKLLQSTVDEALAKATDAGPSRWAGTAGARSDLDPEHHLRQEQYRQDMGGYDADRHIAETEAAYADRGVEIPQVMTGRQQGFTASIGTSKVTVSLPPVFDPVKDKWLLWKPQVQDYFVMVGLPGVLDPVQGFKLSLQANRIALGTLKAICPPQDAAHIIKHSARQMRKTLRLGNEPLVTHP